MTTKGAEFTGCAFAVNAFVELVKQYGMDEYEFETHETKTYEVIEDVKNRKSKAGIFYPMKRCRLGIFQEKMRQSA